MSKIYYIQSSDNELYHWKYIKREKINGKWRYYYDKPEDDKDTKKETKLSKYVKGIKTDIAESKQRAAKYKYGGSNFVKEYVKDRLGYDEKERYVAAKENRKATKRREEMGLEFWSSKADKLWDAKYNNKGDVKKAQSEEDQAMKWLIEDRAKDGKAVREVINAQAAYKKTALYKIEKVGKALSNTAADINSSVKEFPDSVKRGTKKVSEILSDAAFEVEWQTKKALGLKAKDWYETKREWHKEATDEFRSATSRYENSSKDSFEQWLYDRAAEQYENSERTTQKARDDYARTPVGMIDIGHEYVEDWFEELKKKRKK